ncbi:MAG: hypothetical protein L6R35_005174, partial [Caloplaca aegaea]
LTETLKPDVEGSLQDILLLDKSTAPLTAQINEACDILKISTVHTAKANHVPERCNGQHGPREEWTLRWLLKKLERTGPEPRSVYLEPKVWSLILELVRRLRVPNLARLLRAHSFINILANALKILEDSLRDEKHVPPHSSKGASSASSVSSNSSGAMDSSSATVEACIVPSIISRKRKRDGPLADQHPASAPHIVNLELVFWGIGAVLIELQEIMEVNSYDYVNEHLKMAFRVFPDQAAEILGRSHTITSFLLRTRTETLVANSVSSRPLSPRAWFRLWDSRSSRAGGTGTELAFASTCFIPTLELLETLDRKPNGVEDPGVILTTLKRHVLEYIILPARQCLEKSKLRTAKGNGLREISIDQLLSPLRNLVSQSGHKYKFHDEKLNPIARFYRIIVENTPLQTTKQRLSERAWLQFMFDHITTQISIFGSDSSDFAPNPHSTEVLKDMLGIVSSHNIKLETATLEKVLAQCSNLLNEESLQVDWDVVLLCLEIDPDVFVIPAFAMAVADTPIRKPNSYLSALFQTINNLVQSLPVNSEYSRRMHQAELVLVSLVKGFAQARDLIGFVDHWTSNLVYTQSLTEDSDDRTGDPDEQTDDGTVDPQHHSRANKQPNVWESEVLLQAVATEVELRLTIGQIEKILQKSKLGLSAMDPDSGQDQGRHAAADLVVLDCILSSCNNEYAVEQLAEIIQDLYIISFASFEAEVLPKFHIWRLWRCMATMKSRWVIQLSQSAKLRQSEENITKKALEQFSNLNRCHSMEALLQSLNYVLSVIESPGFPLRNRFACSTIKATTAAFEHYGQRINSQDEEMDFDPHILRAEERVADMKHLMQSFASQLCLRPTTLLLSTPELQTAFFEWLLEIGQWVQDAEPRPWEDFLHSSALEEDQALAQNFRFFLVETFLDVHPNIDADVRKYDSVFDSIHKTPSHALDRKQWAKIFNRILENLLEGTLLTPQTLKNHLKLLIDHLAHPSKYINLVQHPSGLTNNSAETGYQSSALVRLAIILNRIDDQDNEALDLLKHFAEKVLECQLLRDDKTHVFSYLKAHYQFLLLAQDEKDFCDGEFSMMLVAVSLSFYQVHLDDFPAPFQHSDGGVSEFRSLMLAIMNKATDPILFRIRRPNASDTAHYYASVVLSSYALYMDTCHGTELHNFRNDMQILVDNASKLISRRSECSQSREGTIAKLLLNASQGENGFVGSLKAVNLLELYQTSDTLFSIQKQKEHVSRVLRASEGLELDDKANIMTALTPRADEDLPDRASLLLLQGLVVSHSSTDTREERSSRALSSVVTHLSDKLLEPQKYESIILSLQSIDLILRKHPHTITQYNIDQIMAAITTCACRRSSKCTLKQTSLQYLALCRVFSSVLAFHRKRLGGRYHLTISTLQSLLRPLFIPFTSSASPTSSNLFTAAHASAYSRLLHQLADPSLPSLTPHHSRRDQGHHNLNDATKTAKSIAGQYLHYLVMTYCECQLKGRLEKEVREKLKSGLWVVLDVIPQEQMRVMNAAMGKEGRGVWKGLYAEWRRERGGRERS